MQLTTALPGHDRNASAHCAAELTVEVISDLDGLRGIGPIWNEVLEKAGMEHPFSSHEWMCAWCETLGSDKQLRILLVRDSREVIGIAPLMLSWEQLTRLPVRRLGSITNDHSPRYDFIVARDAEAVYQAILDHVLESDDKWDVFELCQLSADSPTLSQISRISEHTGLRTGTWDAGGSPYLSLDGSWEQYRQSLSRNRRYQLKKKLKRLGELGEVGLETISSSDALEQALEDGFAIESAAWKGDAGTAITSQEEVRRFYGTFAELAARRGWLRLDFLTLDGTRIAFAFTILYDNKLFLLKPGYDPQYSAYSPGNLLFDMVLREAYDKGIAEYDFLGKDDPWKLAWTSTVRDQRWLFVFPPTLRGAALHRFKFRLVPTLKSRLPLHRFRNAMQQRLEKIRWPFPILGACVLDPSCLSLANLPL